MVRPRTLWSWKDAVDQAKRHGVLRISWNWSNRQRLAAAKRAVKRGALERVRGKPGAD